ncbi:hypothetical protein F5Y18DRAFT_200785 [Xylariaceae sp. FL1019]|nr:hypothetical protein F5Y18DRAFT_200785 [Xylariaceae sp. FL1019]
MPSVLNEEDKEIVKRIVPKQTNKIQAVAVARLYVAYPSRSRWTYTGLQGAVVLANDLVGNTYWLKMVDISPARRGVIWDQEIFESWSYNADRTFFHTFEIEECWAALSFHDEKEAKQFKKKMDDREKNASKATKATPFGGANQQQHHKTGFFGSLFGGGSRHASNPTPPESPRSSLPTLQSQARLSSVNLASNGYHKPPSEFSKLEAYDPDWRDNFGNFLQEQGLTDEFIRENQDFIVEFLKEQGGSQASSATHAPPPPPPPPPAPSSNGHARAPPPPPPPAPATRPASDSISSSGSRRGAPPPPPAPRRSGKLETVPPREPTPPQESTPPRPRFNAPPPIADAGKFAHVEPPRAAPAGPAPPPRPPKTPIDAKEEKPTHKFGVPPAFTGQRLNNVPPPPPARGPVPAPPPRETPSAPPPLPPTLPPKGPSSSPPPVPGMSRPVPAAPPRSVPPPLPQSGAPQPPPLPQSSAPPPPPLPPPSGMGAPPPPPPPPPPPGGAGMPPPPPPLPPNRDSGYASAGPTAALPSADAGRSAMLDGIQKAGGIASLKKVDKTQIRDRSGASVGGSGSDTGPHGSGLPPSGVAPGGGGGMADALALALQKRKAKVRDSDDEKSDDEW